MHVRYPCSLSCEIGLHNYGYKDASGSSSMALSRSQIYKVIPTVKISFDKVTSLQVTSVH